MGRDLFYRSLFICVQIKVGFKELQEELDEAKQRLYINAGDSPANSIVTHSLSH